MFAFLSDLALKFVSLENIVVFFLGLSIGYLLPRHKNSYKSFPKLCEKDDELYEFFKIYKNDFFYKSTCPKLKNKICQIDSKICPFVEPTFKEIKRL